VAAGSARFGQRGAYAPRRGPRSLQACARCGSRSSGIGVKPNELVENGRVGAAGDTGRSVAVDSRPCWAVPMRVAVLRRLDADSVSVLIAWQSLPAPSSPHSRARPFRSALSAFCSSVAASAGPSRACSGMPAVPRGGRVRAALALGWPRSVSARLCPSKRARRGGRRRRSARRWTARRLQGLSAAMWWPPSASRPSPALLARSRQMRRR
jgi:hypothetical protein